MKRRRHSREESFHRRTLPGAAPGTVAVDPEAPRPLVRLVAYDAERCLERDAPNLKQVATLRADHAVVWLDLDGLGDRETIRKRCLEHVLPSVSPRRYGSIGISIPTFGARSISWRIPRHRPIGGRSWPASMPAA